MAYFSSFINFVQNRFFMYRTALSILLITLLVATGCTGRKSGSSKAYIKPHIEQSDPNANNITTTPIDKAQFITYNRELQMKMQAFNIDFRKVQVYLDQKIVLTKAIDSSKAEVASGVLRIINSSIIDEITINAYTPGIIESVDIDGIVIKFDQGGSLRFVPTSGPDAEDNYVIAGNNWSEGLVEIQYGKKTYKASCTKCPSMASVHPVIKQADIDKKDKKSKVLPGIKIN